MLQMIKNFLTTHRPMHVFTPDEYSLPMTRERKLDTWHMAIPLIIFFFSYMGIFQVLEHMERVHYTVIHTRIDDMIPFCEYFIIPYELWFVYVGCNFLFFLFKHDKVDYYRNLVFMFTGMFLFLFVCIVFPTMVQLRPQTFPRDNLCTTVVKWLYAGDTPTNVFPSMHAYNAIGAWLSVKNSYRFDKRPFERGVTFALMILVLLATMFLKQHSALDVGASIALAVVMNYIVYHTDLVANRLGLGVETAKET